MIDKNDPKYAHYPHIESGPKTPSDAPKINEEQKVEVNTSNGESAVETNSEHNTERITNNNDVMDDVNNVPKNLEPKKQSSFWSAMFLIIALLAIGVAAFI